MAGETFSEPDGSVHPDDDLDLATALEMDTRVEAPIPPTVTASAPTPHGIASVPNVSHDYFASLFVDAVNSGAPIGPSCPITPAPASPSTEFASAAAPTPAHQPSVSHPVTASNQFGTDFRNGFPPATASSVPAAPAVATQPVATQPVAVYPAHGPATAAPSSSLENLPNTPRELPDVATTGEGGRATINDVARAAGVSVATVSKVVNGRYGVSPATVAKVTRVVEQLGYESSIVASSLRRSATNVIGVLVSGFDPFSTELLKGISTHAVGRGYQLLAYSGAIADDRATGWERRSISRLAGTLIDGAIIITPSEALPVTKMPLVAIDPFNDPNGPPYVNTDSLACARGAVEYLLSLGHTKIGHIRGRLDLESAHVRERGWRDAMDAAGLHANPAYIRDGGYRRDWAYEACLGLLRQNDRPTAVFAANDTSAFGVMDAAAELGLRVPEDLSVIGFDDVPEAATSQPRLTTVAQPLPEMGARAFDMLLDLIKGAQVQHHVQIPANLVVRGTTAPPPTD